MVSPKGLTKVAELVGRIIAGDRKAEDELVRRYRDGVLIIIGRIVWDHSVAEDLSQDALIIILEKVRRGDVREPERLSGFVCAVARNHAIEYIRRARRLARHEEIGKAEAIPDPAPTPFELVLREQRDAVIRELISEMKVERDREVLFRFYIAEDSKDQVCAELALRSRQFDNVVYRAKERYKEIYLKRVGRKRGVGS